MSNRHNLDKLKQLCDELSDRDEQLKINAAALWDILDVASKVRDDLSKIKAKDNNNAERIKLCIEELKKVDCIISTKGCKKVQNDH